MPTASAASPQSPPIDGPGELGDVALVAIHPEKNQRVRRFATNSGDQIEDQLRHEFNKQFFPLNEINYKKERQLFKSTVSMCSPGGTADLSSLDQVIWKKGRIWCSCASLLLRQNDWLPPARQLLLTLWNQLGETQAKLGRRISRAIIGQSLTELEHDAKRAANCFRWALLTHAECALDGEGREGAFSEHWLDALGVLPAEREVIERIAKKCKSTAKKVGWRGPSAISEEVLRLCCEDPIGIGLLTRFTTQDEFPLSVSYLRLLIAAVRSARANDEKGKSLENLACYLFLLFSGCIPRRNLKDVAGAAEYDVVVFNYSSDGNAFASRFGRQFLIECKNWNKKVSVRDVGYFLERMHLTNCHFGVMLSRNGVTGRQREESNARSLIRRAFHQDNAICLVVSLEDIEHLCDQTFPSVTSLLVDLANRLQFGN